MKVCWICTGVSAFDKRSPYHNSTQQHYSFFVSEIFRRALCFGQATLRRKALCFQTDLHYEDFSSHSIFKTECNNFLMVTLWSASLSDRGSLILMYQAKKSCPIKFSIVYKCSQLSELQKLLIVGIFILIFISKNVTFAYKLSQQIL